MPHVHIPVPRPETPPEPAVIQVNEGIVCGVRIVFAVGVVPDGDA